MRSATSLAALALLAGCDPSGQGNDAGSSNQAAAQGSAKAAATKPPPIIDPQRLEQVSRSFRVDANSDGTGFDVIQPVEIRLPDIADVRKDRTYLFHARAEPVTIQAAPAQTIEGSSRLALERGDTAILVSDGRDSWLLIDPATAE